MTINLSGISRDSKLAARIEKRLAGELRKVRTAPVTARVSFFDENGPKGGRAIRCALTVSLPRRPLYRVEEVAETQWLAFDRCFGSLRRRLTANRERSLKQTRYPKKYYAATRLLTTGVEPEAEA
jgi:hypothetical protein